MVKRYALYCGALSEVIEGCAGEYVRTDDYDALAARLAEADRHLREIADMDWRGNCPPAVMVAKHYWERTTASAPVCKCDMRTKLVGDGCEVCNPELAAEYTAATVTAVQPSAEHRRYYDEHEGRDGEVLVLDGEGRAYWARPADNQDAP